MMIRLTKQVRPPSKKKKKTDRGGVVIIQGRVRLFPMTILAG
jgi:hypothetical protein